MSLSETISARTHRFMETTLGTDTARAQDHLSSRRVRIALDPLVAGDYTGQMILFTLLNLLVRLDAYCPALEVVVPEVARHPLVRLLPPGALGTSLFTFFSSFPAARRLSIRSTEPVRSSGTDISLGISPRPTPGAVSIWADGWIVYLNAPAPTGAADLNPVGASVAAGLGAAELFKRLVLELPLRPGLRVLPIEHLIFSTYDYRLEAGENPPLPSVIDVDGVVVVGLGGIGAAFVAGAAGLSELTGHLTLVDRDEVDRSSFNRHLVAVPGDTGPKVALCRRALSFHADVEARAEWFEEFVGEKGDRLDLVVVGVDKDAVRRDIQEKLPRLVLNGGTSDSASFRVSRHHYRHGACLSCISREDLQDHPVERGLAQLLGIDVTTVLHYRNSGAPVPPAVLRAAGILSEEEIQRLGDRTLIEIQQRVCAELRLGTGPRAEAVSISFLSALPGFLLLGEMIKERSYPGVDRPPLNDAVNHLLLSVLGRPHPRLLHGWFAKREGCDCQRGAYRRAYERQWPVAN